MHNFIVNYREEKEKDTSRPDPRQGPSFFRDEFDEVEELNRASDQFIRQNPFHSFGSGSFDNNLTAAAGLRGRRTNAENSLRDDGVRFRNIICNDLHRKGMARPTVNQSMRRDRFYRPVL